MQSNALVVQFMTLLRDIPLALSITYVTDKLVCYLRIYDEDEGNKCSGGQISQNVHHSPWNAFRILKFIALLEQSLVEFVLKIVTTAKQRAVNTANICLLAKNFACSVSLFFLSL